MQIKTIKPCTEEILAMIVPDLSFSIPQCECIVFFNLLLNTLYILVCHKKFNINFIAV
jgi:hypothetical protein